MRTRKSIRKTPVYAAAVYAVGWPLNLGKNCTKQDHGGRIVHAAWRGVPVSNEPDLSTALKKYFQN